MVGATPKERIWGFGELVGAGRGDVADGWGEATEDGEFAVGKVGLRRPVALASSMEGPPCGQAWPWREVGR
jgi:hypothetical protein